MTVNVIEGKAGNLEENDFFSVLNCAPWLREGRKKNHAVETKRDDRVKLFEGRMHA
jgi:hypothetical protein